METNNHCKIEILDYLRYCRNSLADSNNLSPYTGSKTNIDGLIIDNSEKLTGRISAEKAFNIFKESGEHQVLNNLEGMGEEILSVSIIICPNIYIPKSEHGVGHQTKKQISPICLPCRINRAGEITIEKDTYPWIPREYLLPSCGKDENILGEQGSLDKFYSSYPIYPTTWEETLQYGEWMKEAVCDPIVLREDYEQAKQGRIIVKNSSSKLSMIKSLIELYEHAIEGKVGVNQLTKRVVMGFAGKEIEVSSLLQYTGKNTGTMSKEFSLGKSQRIAVSCISEIGEGESIAVNGPPGTGKTTLIQNIIASQITNAAISGGEAPIIVVTSQNNQAIKNAVKSLGDNHERWVSGIKGLGLYLQSSSGKNDVMIDGVATNVIKRGQGKISFAGFNDLISDKTWLIEAEQDFIRNFNKRFPTTTIEDIGLIIRFLQRDLIIRKDILFKATHEFKEMTIEFGEEKVRSEGISKLIACQESEFRKIEDLIIKEKDLIAYKQQELERLKRTVNDFNQIIIMERAELKELKINWLKHRNSESIWLTLLSFLPAIKEKKKNRDLLFWSSTGIADTSGSSDKKEGTTGIIEQIEEALDKKEKKGQKSLQDAQDTILLEKEQIRINVENRQKHLFKLMEKAYTRRKIMSEVGELCETEILSKEITIKEVMDIVDRSVKFGNFGLALHYWEGRGLQALSIGMENSKNPEKMRKTYRIMAMFAPCFISTFHTLPSFFKGYLGVVKYMTNEIDCLIIDEAGQANTFIGIASLLLAKKAVIIGDTKQIQPVDNLSDKADMGNAIKYKVVKDKNGYEQARESGILAKDGSMMKIAQRASNYRLPDKVALEKGFWLTEHRRCVPEIISYCNKLTYMGILEPLRKTIDKEKRILPAVGWANIQGEDEKMSGSKSNQTEADVIADWVSKWAVDLEKYYGKPIGKILGIITPFKPQERLIGISLKREGVSGITVGTLHTFQGAEREVIIFSPVYGLNSSGMPFIDNELSMLNVAVSRAKDSFLVFGCMKHFRQGYNNPSSKLADILFSDMEHEIYDILPVNRNLGVGVETERLSGTDAHISFLCKNLPLCKEKIVITSPYLTSRAIMAGEGGKNLIYLLKETTARGIEVIIYIDSYGFNCGVSKGRASVKDINLLIETGARIFLTKDKRKMYFHNKTLICDNSIFIEGSFNWLSAPRGKMEKQEASMVHSGVIGVRAWTRKFEEEMISLGLEEYSIGKDIAFSSNGHRVKEAYLYADMVGSTTHYNHVGDETANKITMKLFEMAGENISKFSGEIIKTTGDGIIAHFPDVVSGIKAGLKIASWDIFPVRVGVVYGEATQMGNDHFGKTLSFGARVMSSAGGREVYIDEGTAKHIGSAFQIKSEGEKDLKGIGLVKLFKVLS